MFSSKTLLFRNYYVIFASNVYKVTLNNLQNKRNLISLSYLRIPKFLEDREKFLKESDIKEFKNKMKEKYIMKNLSMVFTEDIKKMIRIAETDEDLEFTQYLLEKYKKQSISILFQGFKFGPEVMRLYYILNKPLPAVALFTNPKLCTMFDSPICYLLLLDMLYENQHYKEVLDTYEKIIQPFTRKEKLYSLHQLVYLASCYKMNTPETYQKALDFCKLNSEKKRTVFTIHKFLMIIAFNQGDDLGTDEILSFLKNDLFVFSLKSMALAREKKYKDVLAMLNEMLNPNKKDEKDDGNDKITDNPTKQVITQDAMSFLEKEFQNSGDALQEFNLIKMKFIDHDSISKESLEQILFAEIESTGKLSETTQKRDKKIKFLNTY